MSQFDIRGLLQYVPSFAGRCFVVQVDEELLAGSTWLDIALDLGALQDIGVKLAILVPQGRGVEVFEDLVLADVRTALAGGPEEPSVAQVIGRGQAAVHEVNDELLSAEVRECAKSLKAAKLILLTEHSLAIGADGSECAVKADAVAGMVSRRELKRGDLFEKAAESCRNGIPRVHFLDGLDRGVLLRELFSNQGVGTMVYADAYQELRRLEEDDIPELLSLIGRSMQDSTIVARSYETIKERMNEYWLLTVDENVVGSVALYEYEGSDWAEIGCLYIKGSHEGLGYGRQLVAHAENVAKELGKKGVFALSRSAVAYFRDRLHYEPLNRDMLPASRLEALIRSGRNSELFGKYL